MRVHGGGGLVSVDTVWILWHGDNLSTLYCMVEGQVSWGIVILNKATFQKVRRILTVVTEKARHSPHHCVTMNILIDFNQAAFGHWLKGNTNDG